MKYGSIERAVYEDSFCKIFSKIYLNHKEYKTPFREKLLLLFKKKREHIIKSCNVTFIIYYKYFTKGGLTLYILNYRKIN